MAWCRYIYCGGTFACVTVSHQQPERKSMIVQMLII
jgi:hypothetical protein